MRVPCDFVSLYLFVLTMKLKSANYKSHWNTLALKYFRPGKIMSDLNISHGKISDFDSFPFFGLTLAIKLRNVDLEGH